MPEPSGSPIDAIRSAPPPATTGGTARRPHWEDRLAAWWLERFDLRPLLDPWRNKSVPCHPYCGIYLLGGAALFLFGLQAASGCLLMVYYLPTAEAAYASVERIITEVPYGWLIRSLHVWGAHTFVAVVLLHFVTVLLTKAYRRPRELTWCSGVALLLVTALMGFSGYLLPWTQLSYFATLVGTQLPGCLPVVGDALVGLLRGGRQVDGATLTRFYALHVAILPLGLGLLAGLHLLLVQVLGVGLPAGLPPASVRDREPFFSEFLLREAGYWLLLFGGLVTLALYWPAPLGPRADPWQPAPAGINPEWYFLPVFQLLKEVPERVGVWLLVAGLCGLFVIPFLDRRAARGEPSRGATLLYALLLAAAGLLYLRALLAPAAHPATAPLQAATYRPLVDSLWLAMVWLVIGFLCYVLWQLRRLNRQRRAWAGAPREANLPGAAE